MEKAVYGTVSFKVDAKLSQIPETAALKFVNRKSTGALFGSFNSLLYFFKICCRTFSLRLYFLFKFIDAGIYAVVASPQVQVSNDNRKKKSIERKIYDGKIFCD